MSEYWKRISKSVAQRFLIWVWLAFSKARTQIIINKYVQVCGMAWNDCTHTPTSCTCHTPHSMSQQTEGRMNHSAAFPRVYYLFYYCFIRLAFSVHAFAFTWTYPYTHCTLTLLFEEKSLGPWAWWQSPATLLCFTDYMILTNRIGMPPLTLLANADMDAK